MGDQPAICIDLKKYRIRIHKLTLHMLGDPKFIQLLINPEDLILAIRAADCSESMTHRIVLKNFVGKPSYELTSMPLIKKLQSVCANWNAGESYRLNGEMVPSQNMALFDLQNVVPCASDWEMQDE